MKQTDKDKRIKNLIKLGSDKGFLTPIDLTKKFPAELINPEEFDAIKILLQGIGVEILEIPEDVEKEKKVKEKKTAKKPSRAYEILDDPVRMYLRQMGQVPLLSREQEVEISKRIEKAEKRVYSITLRFGDISHEMLSIARRVLSGKERFDRMVVERKGHRRENYLKELPKLMKEIAKLDSRIKAKIKSIRSLRYKEKQKKRRESELKDLKRKMIKLLKRLRFKQVVIEDIYPVLEKYNNKILEVQKGLAPLVARKKKSNKVRNQIKNERRKLRRMELNMQMPIERFQNYFNELTIALINSRRAKGEMVEANLRLVISIA
ncbi:MAG: sigma-70 factor domain-containing protein, partial [Candidatus Auribacterota bacterium]|nr:sigma-70 factor domain-containing protein [Candidatus Auribacterota bacterium]